MNKCCEIISKELIGCNKSPIREALQELRYNPKTKEVFNGEEFIGYGKLNKKKTILTITNL